MANERLNTMRGEGVWPRNENLLDNGDFANPVNQNGKEEYTTGITIDRWGITPDQRLTVADDGIHLHIAKNTNLAYGITQVIDNDFYGETVTLSVLVDAITGPLSLWARTSSWASYGKIDFSAPGLYSITVTPTRHDNFRFCLVSGGETDATIRAAKLERGPIQTLAHKEGGQLVLNRRARYEDELARCQRYKFSQSVASNAIYGRVESSCKTVTAFCPLPVTPRAAGTYSIPSMIVVGNGASVSLSNMTGQVMKEENGVVFSVSGDFSSIGARQFVMAYCGSGISFDFNL